MRILVDGDASGQRDVIVSLAIEFGAPLLWVHNPSHRPPVPQEGLNLEVHLADGGSQAADVVVMNFAGADDIVVTGDLGLALVCVAKGAAAISPRGFWYRSEDMATRMEFRALAARLKRGGEYLHHKPPHRRLDDWRFEQELRRALA
jgi:uncharacterized protein